MFPSLHPVPVPTWQLLRPALALLLASAVAVPASAAELTALQLNLYRDGSPADWLLGQNRLLADSFDNGDPYLGPPFPDGSPSVYTLQGLENPANAALALREEGGALQMDPRYGAVSSNASGLLGRSLRLRLLTTIDDVNAPDRGLPRSRSFAATLRLSLAAMPDEGQSFGLRFTDNYSNNNDVIELFVAGGAAGDTLLFREQDFVTGTVNWLGSAALAPPVGADSLVLVLSHSAPDTDAIFGSYGFTDALGTGIGGLTTFTDATGAPAAAFAFDGEGHTRIELRATAPVPEPGTWALFAAGLGVLALRARRRDQCACTAASGIGSGRMRSAQLTPAISSNTPTPVSAGGHWPRSISA